MISESDLEIIAGFYELLEATTDSELTPLEMAKEFATAMNQKPDPLMSAYLIDEEYKEWDEAYTYEDHASELKELADLVYVIYGYANVKKWDLDEAVRRVHQSNMSKLGDDGKPIYRQDGKVMKGPNYKKPDLSDLV